MIAGRYHEGCLYRDGSAGEVGTQVPAKHRIRDVHGPRHAEVHLTDALYNLPTPARRLFEALQRGDLAGGKPRETTPMLRRRLRHLSPADVDQLVSDYCAGHGSIYELADRWGVHRNTIAKHLKSRGLELGRLSLTSEEIRRAQALRESGLSFNAIGRALDRDPKTVKSALS